MIIEDQQSGQPNGYRAFIVDEDQLSMALRAAADHIDENVERVETLTVSHDHRRNEYIVYVWTKRAKRT